MDKPVWIEGHSWQANSYVAGNILIDAAVSAEKIEPYKNDIDTIILTHGHFDHFANLKTLADLCDAEVYIGEHELEFLSNSALSLSSHFARKAESCFAKPLKDGDLIGGFKVYHTPGHTRGSICLFREEDGSLVSGDTVFPGGSFGRTDLPTGNSKDLINSINRVAELDIESIFPGHDIPVLSGGKKEVLLSQANAKNYA